MAKRARGLSETVIERRLAEGRGRGRGVDYDPWLHIQDVPSEGDVHRPLGSRHRRVYHLLSDLELRLWYMA
jgi:hypothetical protein